MSNKDIIKLSFLSIKSKKMKSITFILIMTLFMILITCFFSGKDSFTNFISDYQNADFHYKIIAIKTDNNNASNVMDDIESLNNKHISKIFKNNSVLMVTANFENGKGGIELYGNYTGINYSIVAGTDIKNDNEMVCPDTFFPGVYTAEHNKNNYYDMTKYINKSFNIKFDQLYVIDANTTKLLKSYSYDLKLVGTYDMSKNLVGYNVCYVSTSFFEKLATEAQAVYKDSTLGASDSSEVLVLVDDYKNVNDVMKEIKAIGYSTRIYYELDLDFFNTIAIIINIASLIIIAISILCIYLFYKSTLIENQKDIALYQLIGYDNKEIKKIYLYQYIINIFVALILGIICSNIIRVLITNWLSNDPNYSVLNIFISYTEIFIYFILIILLCYIVTSKLFVKKISKIQPIKLMEGEL